MNTLFRVLFAMGVIGFISSCAVVEPEERPIRPTSENSNLAHAANQSTGEGALGNGALSQ